GGSSRTLRIEAVGLAPDHQHRVLDQILGRTGRHAALQKETLQARSEMREQKRELLPVTPLRDGDDAIGPVRHGKGCLPDGGQPPGDVRPRTITSLPCRAFQRIMKLEGLHDDSTVLAGVRISPQRGAAARARKGWYAAH